MLPRCTLPRIVNRRGAADPELTHITVMSTLWQSAHFDSIVHTAGSKRTWAIISRQISASISELHWSVCPVHWRLGEKTSFLYTGQQFCLSTMQLCLVHKTSYTTYVAQRNQKLTSHTAAWRAEDGEDNVSLRCLSVCLCLTDSVVVYVACRCQWRGRTGQTM